MSASGGEEIRVWDRSRGATFIEKVYGDSALQWAYGTSLGRCLTRGIFSRAFVSQLYGAMQGSRWSQQKITPFIQRYDIQLDEFETTNADGSPWGSFNDFFIRRFKPGRRPFAPAPELAAPCEARYLAFAALKGQERVPVKGFYLSSAEILENPKWEKTFAGGPAFIARLCPVDYHRYHFPDSGRVLDRYARGGKLHSVNPIALRAFPGALCQNERRITIVETEHLGKLALISVGALMVGKIVERGDSGPALTQFTRGEEHGYFLFGGSTLVVLGEPGYWSPHADILGQTRLGQETYLRLGESLGI